MTGPRRARLQLRPACPFVPTRHEVGSHGVSPAVRRIAPYPSVSIGAICGQPRCSGSGPGQLDPNPKCPVESSAHAPLHSTVPAFPSFLFSCPRPSAGGVEPSGSTGARGKARPLKGDLRKADARGKGRGRGEDYSSPTGRFRAMRRRHRHLLALHQMRGQAPSGRLSATGPSGSRRASRRRRRGRRGPGRKRGRSSGRRGSNRCCRQRAGTGPPPRGGWRTRC
jgi:hypothetical protein